MPCPVFFKCLQRQWLYHLPGQKIPVPNHYFSKEFFFLMSNLNWLILRLCPLLLSVGCLREETDPHLSTASVQVVGENLTGDHCDPKEPRRTKSPFSNFGDSWNQRSIVTLQGLREQWRLLWVRTTEWTRLEKIFEIIKSNLWPNITSSIRP